MIRLRGHHLVCLRFYQGEGFPPSYGANLRSLVIEAQQEGVSVVLGADQVCAFCPSMKEGLCEHGPGWEEEISAMDQAAMELLKVRPQDTISWEELGERLRSCFSQWWERFCLGCAWKSVCRSQEYCKGKDRCAAKGR